MIDSKMIFPFKKQKRRKKKGCDEEEVQEWQ
jgi:hypothetical protein